MNQLAPTAVEANSQDATPSTEVVEEPEVVTSKVEDEVEETKPELKTGPQKTVPLERFNEIYGQMRRLDRLAMQLLEERKTQKPPTKEQETEPEPDYDSFTPKQLVEHMRKTSRKDLEEVLSQTLTPLNEQAKLRAASDSITQAASKFPDFFDHRDAMIGIAEKHPDLDAEEVYLLATGKKGPAADKIMARVKEKVDQKKNALTTRRSSLSPKLNTTQSFKSVREGALAAAKELGLDID